MIYEHDLKFAEKTWIEKVLSGKNTDSTINGSIITRLGSKLKNHEHKWSNFRLELSAQEKMNRKEFGLDFEQTISFFVKTNWIKRLGIKSNRYNGETRSRFRIF